MSTESTNRDSPIELRKSSNRSRTTVRRERRAYEWVIIKPDQNIAWLLTFCAFLMNMVIDGFIYSFGAISDDLKKNFNCLEWEVSLVISLAVGFYLLSAPFASAFCTKFGCGVAGIFGSLLASVSIVISIYSPSIYLMWILFGGLGGIGFSFIYLPSIVIIGESFESRRAIATGIVTAGTGIGAITFGPLSNYLFKNLGWQLGLGILACLIMICAYCSLIMVPFRVEPENVNISNQVENQEEESLDSVFQSDPTETCIQIDQISGADDELVNNQEALTSTTTEVGTEVISLLKITENGNLPSHQSNHVDNKDQPSVNGNFCKDILLNIFSSFNQYEDSFELRNMILICVGNIASMIGYFIPYLFIVKVATSKNGINRDDATFLISIIGFTNTIGRLLSGFIAKIKPLNALRLHNIGLFVAGISTMLVPLYNNYMLLSIFCAVWGAFIAFHVALGPVIICDIFGVDKFSSTLSITLMFRGITSLITPPIMGGIHDITSSFNIPFIIGGFSFILGGLAYCFIGKRREEKTANQ